MIEFTPQEKAFIRNAIDFYHSMISTIKEREDLYVMKKSIKDKLDSSD